MLFPILSIVDARTVRVCTDWYNYYSYLAYYYPNDNAYPTNKWYCECLIEQTCSIDWYRYLFGSTDGYYN